MHVDILSKTALSLKGIKCLSKRQFAVKQLSASFFSALMLLVGPQEGHPDSKSSATTIRRSLLWGTGVIWTKLTWHILTWSNSGKMGRLDGGYV